MKSKQNIIFRNFNGSFFNINALTIIKKLGLLFAIIFILFSCDKIEKPYIEEGAWLNTGKKVLLEEFTGVRCVNCPEAHKTIELLKDKYGDQLITVAYHVGDNAIPIYSTDADFRTGLGDTLDIKFGASMAGLPTGMINRFSNGNSHLINPTSWGSVIDSTLRAYPKALIEIENQHDTLTRKLETKISTDILQDISGDIYLITYIIEDSIVGNQVSAGSKAIIPNYMHRHVFRNHINGIWGEKIASGGVQVDQYFEKQYSFTLDTNWNQYKCHVVAYIYNRETLEVIQAEESRVVE